MKQKYFLWALIISLPVVCLSQTRPSNITFNPSKIVNKKILKIEHFNEVDFSNESKNLQRFFETVDTDNSVFYKTSGATNNTTLEEDSNRFIRIGYIDPEMFHRQILLGFLPNSRATLDFNMGYDAVMLDPRDDEMFFIIENDLTRKYVIQGVGAYHVSYEFPIGFNIREEGTHTIMLDALENFEDIIYIKDNVLNTKFNLSESDFNLKLPPGDYLGRFSIVFSDIALKSTLDSTDIFTENNLRVYYLNNKIVINNTNNLKLSDVTIFNTVGQKIIELNKIDLSKHQIIIPFSYQQGLYVVKVELGPNKKTFKIIN